MQKGDLLLASSGNSWGKVASFEGEESLILNTSTIRLNPLDNNSHLGFIKFLLKSAYVQEQLGLMMTGACQPNFGPTHLNKLEVFFPPFHEQKVIANYLSEKTTKLDTIIQKEQQRINLLKEYRQSLISEVVTGKICVHHEIPVT